MKHPPNYINKNNNNNPQSVPSTTQKPLREGFLVHISSEMGPIQNLDPLKMMWPPKTPLSVFKQSPTKSMYPTM